MSAAVQRVVETDEELHRRAGMVLPVTVPGHPGENPFLDMRLTVDETVEIIRRHLLRIAASGQLAVELHSVRHAGGRGLTTTITCTERVAGTPPYSVPD